MSRGMAVGVIIAAPAVIYTMIGGVQAVAWTDVKQIVLIVLALLAIVVSVIAGAARFGAAR